LASDFEKLGFNAVPRLNIGNALHAVRRIRDAVP